MKPVDLRNENFEAIRDRLDKNRREVYARLLTFSPTTTRGLAEEMGWDVLSVRPRVTELVALGLARCVGRSGGEGLYEAVPIPEAIAAFERAQAGAEQMFLNV